MGRWLSDHVLSRSGWDSVCLVDVESSIPALHEAARWYAAQGYPGESAPRVTVAVPPDDERRGSILDDTGSPVRVDDPRTVVVFALPHDVLPNAVRRIVPLLHAEAGLAVVAHGMRRALAILRGGGGERAAYGLHPLFDVSARELDGATVYVAPAREPHANAHLWIVELVRELGGTLRFGSADDHDRSMTVVQAMAHQALLGFAGAVVESGIDLHDDIWAARTPLFETLFGLAVRVLDETQQPTLAGIQVSLDGTGAAGGLQDSAAQLLAAVRTGEAAAVEQRITTIRDRFSGALFDTVRGTAAAAVVAAQSKRAELARHLRSGELVGIRPLGRPDGLRVGRIVDVDPVRVTMQEVLVGPKGRAALLDGPGRANARRLGVGGKPRRTVFSLGHVELVTGAELDDDLDAWLAHIRRDVRFLVPESVAGSGVLQVVAPVAGIRGSEVVSEVVRTGQRSVVVRVEVRVDRDVDDMVEELRSQVQRAFAWPRGLSLPLVTGGGDAQPGSLGHTGPAGRPDRRTRREVTYLGPAGTFSEVAAGHLAADVGIEHPILVPADSFAAVLLAVHAGGVGVVPISSSASGLVSRAAAALLSHDGELAAGGVVDVAVRFDAYVPPDARLDEMRGAPVYSHPQALAQCHNFIRRWGLDPIPCPSTVDALTRVAGASGSGVALAAEGKGEKHGLKVAEREIDDLSGSITRFLILGRPGSFGALVGGSDPTLRSIFVGPLHAVTEHLATGAQPGASPAAYDEILSDGSGQALWVTSRDALSEIESDRRLRSLGRAPWSPRTPIVRVDT